MSSLNQYFSKRMPRWWLLLLLTALFLSATPAAASAPRQEGFPPPERPLFNETDHVAVEIGESNTKVLELSYDFPPAQLSEQIVEKETYLKMAIPGMEQAYDAPGKPAIPYYSRLVAVPQGASIIVPSQDMVVAQTVAGLPMPVQPDRVHFAATEELSDEVRKMLRQLPFTRDEELYGGASLYPAELVRVTPLGTVRGLDLALVSVATAQYDFAKKALTIFDSAKFTLNFVDGLPYFRIETRLSAVALPPHIIQATAINTDAVDEFTLQEFAAVSTFPCFGSEMIIVTDPAFRSAADRLAAAKWAGGLSTRVVETGADPGDAGTTPAEIRQYLAAQYTDCFVELRYVLLLGDAEQIAPGYLDEFQWGSGVMKPGSDFIYGTFSRPFQLPEVAVGRIPVDTLAQADLVIDKIIGYEQTPPASILDQNFYEEATIATYFQCCDPDHIDGKDSAGFIDIAEFARSILRGAGYRVNRLYNTSTAYHSNPAPEDWLDNYYEPNRDPTPRYFDNRAPLPPALAPNGNYAWIDGLDAVRDKVAEGTFLLIHRGRSLVHRWGEPFFMPISLAATGVNMDSDYTPVVYSIGGPFGLYDNETLDAADNTYPYPSTPNFVSAGESFLRQEKGAVAVIGSTRHTYFRADNAMLNGLMDATWPHTIPGNGQRAYTRVGDILQHAKTYMYRVWANGGSTAPNYMATSLLYNLLGDPSMKVWTEPPAALTNSLSALELADDTLTMSYSANGSTVAAMQGGNILARGIVQNGVVTISYFAEPEPDASVLFVASHPKHIAATLPFRQLNTNLSPKSAGSMACADGNLKIDFPVGSVAVDTTLRMSWTATNTVAAAPANHVVMQAFSLHRSGASAQAAQRHGQQPAPHDKLDSPYSFEICAAEENRKGIEDAFVAHFDQAQGLWTPLKADFAKASGCFTANTDQLGEFAILRDASLSFGDDEPQIYLPLIRQ